MKKIIKPFMAQFDVYHDVELDEASGEIIACHYIRREFTAKTATEAGQAYIRDRVKRAAHCAHWRDTLRAYDAENLTPAQRDARLYIGAGGNITQGCSVREEHAAIRAREYIEDAKHTVTLLSVCFSIDLQSYLYDTLKQAVQAGN